VQELMRHYHIKLCVHINYVQYLFMRISTVKNILTKFVVVFAEFNVTKWKTRLEMDHCMPQSLTSNSWWLRRTETTIVQQTS